MSDEAPAPEQALPREDLVAHLKQLEAFVEQSEASGEDIPAEAAEMISRLREIMHALDGLASSMGDLHGRTTP